MIAYSFKSDYSEGSHPNILLALSRTNFDQQDGYGDDLFSLEAIKILREQIENPKADIHFVSGGTQANLIVISSILKSFESVISASTGHIQTHEAGAIEATGHKINSIDSKDGKIRPEDIQNILDEHTTIPHMVRPALVYISNSTEVGTIYKKKELEAISEFCKANGLYLFLDGARIGSALCSVDNDLTLSELSTLVDVFYIGGTKNGALLGEAIVINNERLKIDFAYHLKQRGALLVKGRIFGVQFKELFKDGLFFELAKHANSLAAKMSFEIEKAGYRFLVRTSTNQIFPIFPNKLIDKLSKNYGFYTWSKFDEEHSVIRLVTSWATKEDAVNNFIEDLKNYNNN